MKHSDRPIYCDFPSVVYRCVTLCKYLCIQICTVLHVEISGCCIMHSALNKLQAVCKFGYRGVDLNNFMI